jgi:hypothetical protein
MSKPKVDAVIAAMEVLLTKRQIAVVNNRTRGGSSKLEIIREFLNVGIQTYEAEGVFFRQKVNATFEQSNKLQRHIGDTIIMPGGA